MNYLGRKKLLSCLTPEELSRNDAGELILRELEDLVLPIHQMNQEDEDYLIKYYAGEHPVIANREKVVRPDVNNKITMNFAKSFTRDIVSYFLGKPVQYVQRKDQYRIAAEDMSDALDAEGKNKVDYEIATYMSICGIAYRGIFPEKNPNNGTHIKICSLDPRETFVVDSPDKQVGSLYCGTVYSYPPDPVNREIKTVYTVYTKRKKYTYETSAAVQGFSITGLTLVSESDASLGGNLPIIEYDNSMLRLGDWESELTIMDALDGLTSDSLNDIEQFINSILLMQGFEATEEMLDALADNKILNVSEIPSGVNVVVKYIADQVDSNGIENLREWLESTMRAIVGVPDRKKSGGGADTGDAVFLRDGWQDIDLVAAAKEQFFIESDRKALSTIIYILQTFNEIDKNAKAQDFEIKFSRTKQANLQAKAQAYATLVGAGIAPEDALEFADLTNNVSDVILRAEEYAKQKAQLALETQQQLSNLQAQNTQSDGNPPVNNQQKAGDEQKGN